MSLKNVRYPFLSVKAFTFVSMPVAAVIAVLVFWRSTGDFWVELQITLAVIAAALFAFLMLGLYKGVRLEQPRKDRPVWRPLRNKRGGAGSTFISTDTAGDVANVALDIAGSIDMPKIDLPDVSDSGDDLIGCLLSIVLWIALAVVIVVLLPVLVELAWVVFFVLAAMLYWVFYRALRVVFSHARRCRGKLALSAGYALFYTALYTGWLFAILQISRHLFVKG
jgi:hypothetical protein